MGMDSILTFLFRDLEVVTTVNAVVFGNISHFSLNRFVF